MSSTRRRWRCSPATSRVRCGVDPLACGRPCGPAALPMRLPPATSGAGSGGGAGARRSASSGADGSSRAAPWRRPPHPAMPPSPATPASRCAAALTPPGPPTHPATPPTLKLLQPGTTWATRTRSRSGTARRWRRTRRRSHTRPTTRWAPGAACWLCCCLSRAAGGGGLLAVLLAVLLAASYVLLALCCLPFTLLLGAVNWLAAAWRERLLAQCRWPACKGPAGASQLRCAPAAARPLCAGGQRTQRVLPHAAAAHGMRAARWPLEAAQACRLDPPFSCNLLKSRCHSKPPLFLPFCTRSFLCSPPSNPCRGSSQTNALVPQGCKTQDSHA